MQPIRTGSKQLIREINQAIVLNAVRSAGSVSRSDIARQTGLGLPTISGITAELLEAGLLLEGEPATTATAPEAGEAASSQTSTLGRRPVLLSLNAAAGYALGVKVTEQTVICVLTDLDAQVVARHDVGLRRTDIDSVIDAVVACADALTPAAAGRPIYGVGVGLAGVIDRSQGVVRHATYSDWDAVPLAELLSTRLALPVVIDNDVNALVAAEQWFGAGRGINDFVVVSLGRGIGLGLVLDGRLYRGAAGGAGEFGHIKVVDGGPSCPCGSRGCLEALAGEPAIAASIATARSTPSLTINEALAHAAAGDDEALAVFATAGRVLGTAIGNLLNVLNPRLVILAGEGTRAIAYLLPSLRQALTEAAFDGVADELQLVVEPWDDEAWARGAASLLLGELLQPALRPGEDGRPSLTARLSSSD